MIKRRILSLLLAASMILSAAPVSVYATEGLQDSGATIGTSGLCEHHTEHTADCGYMAGTEEIPCGHEHTEDCGEVITSCTHTHTADCYPVMDSGVSGNEVTPSDAAEPICGHECSEESGCVVQDLNCIHTEHDDSCGYAPAVEESPCDYVCGECAAPAEVCTCSAAGGEAHTEDCALYEAPAEPECICETDDPAFHATNCPAYVAPESPECWCVEKCTEDNPNVWCDVCGVQGAAACKGGEDSAAAYANNIQYIDASGNTQTCASATDIASGTTIWSDGWYYVGGDVTIGSRVNVSGDVHLILADRCMLTVNGGIGVHEGNSLTIYAQSDGANMGTLLAHQADEYDAGIGGSCQAEGGASHVFKSGGTITINGGNVTATGGDSAAGIGGGSRGTGGDVTITGGTVTATGSGSGIGGGWSARGNGSFSTGSNGNAVIVASSIGDTSKQSEWSGIINSTAYGSFSLDSDYTVESGKTLVIDEGAALTIPAGVTLTNNGTIINNGAITQNGTFTNTGAYYEVAISPNTLNFSGVDDKAPAAQTLTITNKSNQAITLSDSSEDRYTVAFSASTLSVAGSTTVTIQPNIGLGGTYNKTLSLGEKNGAYRKVSVTVNPITLPEPQNPAWDNNTFGKAAWNAVQYASGYIVQLYKDGEAYGSSVSVDSTGTEYTFDLFAAGNYTFTVQAKGDGASTNTSPASTSPALVVDGVTVPYLDENGEEKSTIAKPLTLDILADNSYSLPEGWYVVQEDITVAASKITIAGDVHLILADGKTFALSNNGIEVMGSGKHLSVYAQSTNENTMGKLTVKRNGYGSSVLHCYDGGCITINGGWIQIDAECTGIGVDSGSRLVINDGIVRIGQETVPMVGIGYRFQEMVGTIIINGGEVAATGKNAGIGGADYAKSGGKIEINGGTVTAKGTTTDEYSDSGMRLPGDGQIKITGGIVVAEGRNGIDCSNVSIQGGTVIASSIIDNSTVAYTNQPTVEESYTAARTWYGADEASANAAGAKPTSDLAVEANYKSRYVRIAPTYTVTFDPNGGTFSGDSDSKTLMTGAGGKLTILPDAPTFTGFDFSGWFDAQTGGNEITAETVFTSDQTIYAQWTAIRYTVSLISNGGTIGSGNITSYTYGIGATLPTDVTKADHDFGGWYEDSNFSGTAVPAIGTTEIGEKTYYAKWISKIAGIEAVSVNGTAGTINGEQISVVLPYGSTIPTDSSVVEITVVTGATVSADPSTSDSGATWTFIVTAEDGTTTKTYTINVSIAENPAAGNLADIAAAKSTIENHDWTVAQATANTEETVKMWIEAQLAAMNLNGASYTVTMTGGSFIAAAKGSAADQDGTNGGFGFTVALSKGENTGSVATSTYAADTAAVTGGVITATAYSHTHAWSSTDWGKNDTHHWRECTADDCTFTQGDPDSSKGSYGIHTWDNACDTTCNTCGYARSITHSYGTEWSKDASGHWHECSVCHDKKDLASHVPGAEATEDTPQICTVCDFVIKAALEHTHNYGTSLTYDSTGHWYACTCSEKKDFADHSFDDDCDTTCNENCGYTRSINHSPKSEWSQNGDGHWHDCSVCGEDIGFTAHTPGAEATENDPQTCTVCGYVIKAALGHTHNYDTSLTHDSTGHWYACTCSEKKDFAVHSFDDACDTDCNDNCGYTRSITHSYGTEWSKDANGHWHECSVCHDKKDSAGHTPGAAATEDTPQTCTVCGYVIKAATGGGEGSDPAPHSHYGGTPTCQSPATCSGCGQPYGSKDSGNHTGGTETRGYIAPTATAAGFTGNTYCKGCGAQIGTGSGIPATGGGSGDNEDDSGTGGGNTPIVLTVLIYGDENTIREEVSIDGKTAVITDVDFSALHTVIGDHVETGVVTIDFSVLEMELDTVEIPADVVKEIAEAVNDPHNDAESLEIVFTDGTSIEFDAKALGEKSRQAGGLDITISIKHTEDNNLNRSQREAVGDRTAYHINVTSGGKHISDMGGKVTIHAPYELRPGEKAAWITVYYVDDNGNKEACETSYDSVRKRVNWKTDHLSVYMIGYDENINPETGGDLPTSPDTGEGNPFTDVAETDWFFDDVMFVYDNGLMVGTSDTTFSPYGDTSRAMVATVLWRMEGSPEPKGDDPFTDTESGAWYSGGITWAESVGIAEGYGGKLFGPNDPVTREQLAAFFYRYAEYRGYDLSPTDDLSTFADPDSVSDWAHEAVKWAIGSGLITGRDDGRIDPQATATRAEFAAMLHRFIEKYGLEEKTTYTGLMGWVDPNSDYLKAPKAGGNAAATAGWISLFAAGAAGAGYAAYKLRRRKKGTPPPTPTPA